MVTRLINSCLESVTILILLLVFRRFLRQLEIKIRRLLLLLGLHLEARMAYFGTLTGSKRFMLSGFHLIEVRVDGTVSVHLSRIFADGI